MAKINFGDRESVDIFRDIGSLQDKFMASRVFEELCRAFRDNVPVGRHVRHFRMYTDCFVACEAVTWFHRQLLNTDIQFFVSVPSRSQVLRIFDMFYQPWIRVFIDVRGTKYDVMKPKFSDSRRLFRLNPRFEFLEVSHSQSDNYVIYRSPSPADLLSSRASHSTSIAMVPGETMQSHHSCRMGRKFPSEPSLPEDPHQLSCSFRERLESDFLVDDSEFSNVDEQTANSSNQPHIKKYRRRVDVPERHARLRSHGKPRTPLSDCGGMLNSYSLTNVAMFKESTTSLTEAEKRSVCYDIVRERLRDLLGGIDFDQVVGSESLNVTHIVDQLIPYCNDHKSYHVEQRHSREAVACADDMWPKWFSDAMNFLTGYAGYEPLWYVNDLFNLVTDYCLIWREPLLTYQLYEIIVSLFGILKPNPAALPVDKFSSAVDCVTTKYSYSPELRVPARKCATVDREDTGSSLYDSGCFRSLDEETLLADITDDFDALLLQLKNLGNSDFGIGKSTATRNRCTVPYYPPVTTALREADRRFNYLESLCVEYVDDEAVPSPQFQQLASFGRDCGVSLADINSTSVIDWPLCQTRDNFCEPQSMTQSCPDVSEESPLYSPSCHSRTKLFIAPYSSYLDESSASKLVEVLQLCCMTLSVSTRRRIASFFQFLERIIHNRHLVVNRRHLSRQWVLSVFARHILGCENTEMCDDSLAYCVADIFLDRHAEILCVPSALVDRVKRALVKRKLSRKRRPSLRVPVGKVSAPSLSYCERLTSEEYEQQRHDVAHDALLQLLDDIIGNKTMSPTTKKRRLLQFQMSYPELYAGRSTEISDQLVTSDVVESLSVKEPLLKRSLTKLRNLRI